MGRTNGGEGSTLIVRRIALSHMLATCDKAVRHIENVTFCEQSVTVEIITACMSLKIMGIGGSNSLEIFSIRDRPSIKFARRQFFRAKIGNTFTQKSDCDDLEIACFQ